MLLLDDIAYDYINIHNCDIDKLKSFKNLDNIDNLITIESKRNALQIYLMDYISFIPDNIISIRNEINNIIYLFFNEYIEKC
jgi:hypothetical protein